MLSIYSVLSLSLFLLIVVGGARAFSDVLASSTALSGSGSTHSYNTNAFVNMHNRWSRDMER